MPFGKEFAVGLVKKLFWLLLGASLVVAIVRGIPANPGLWGEWGGSQAREVGTSITTWIDQVDIGSWANIKVTDKGSWTTSGGGSSHAKP